MGAIFEENRKTYNEGLFSLKIKFLLCFMASNWKIGESNVLRSIRKQIVEVQPFSVSTPLKVHIFKILWLNMCK